LLQWHKTPLLNKAYLKFCQILEKYHFGYWPYSSTYISETVRYSQVILNSPQSLGTQINMNWFVILNFSIDLGYSKNVYTCMYIVYRCI
jgi:hypothetical protein